MGNAKGKLQIFATSAGTVLARRVCAQLRRSFGKVHLGRFKDGELNPKMGENVRDNDVFIIAPTPVPTDTFFEAMFLTEAARLSSAGRITLVVPYLGYARGDRKDEPRKSIAARMALKVLELAKPDRMILLDVHAEQILGVIENAVFDHLYGSAVAVPHIKHLLEKKRNYIVAAPDHGAAARAHKYARLLTGDENADIAICSKRRSKTGDLDEGSIKIIGSVRNKIVILVDDIIDSATTVCLAAERALSKQAREVWVFGTHPVFSAGALERIRESPISHMFVTDSIYHDPEYLAHHTAGKVTVLSCDTLLADAILRTHEGESLSELIP